MDLIECSLCNNHYNESKHRARNLPCGHYYCQNCLDQIIKSGTPHCPTCRAVIVVRSAEMLPPNFLMDDLINKMRTGLDTMTLDDNEEDFSAGPCPKHKKCQLYFTCKTHGIKICRDCTVIDHKSSQCQIISFEDELEETKKNTINNLKSQKIDREKNISDLQNIITDARAERLKQKQERLKQKQERAKLQSKMNETDQLIDNANKGIQDCKQNKTRIEKQQQELLSSRTINQINQSCREAELTIEDSNSIGISLESNFIIRLVSSKSLQDLIDQSPADFINKVLQGGTTVHVIATINGEKRLSQLVVKDWGIHLPALASCNRPSTAENTVAVSSLLKHYTKANIYMTLACEGKELGTVYITLRNNDSAKYIRKLFLGTIGPSYRGAIFTGKASDCLYTGDVSAFDKSNCLETPPPMPKNESNRRGLIYMIPATGLGISTNAWKKSHVPVVGEIINGMRVVNNAMNFSEGKVIIKDVGIYL